MILYLSIIFVCSFVLALLNIFVGTLFFDYSVWFIILAIAGSVVFEFLVDGLFAFIINKLPNKWFGIENKHFKVSKRSIKFYEKIKIRKWKDKVWDLGGLGGFRKNKMIDPNSPEYIERFIVECNKGVVTHRIGYFVGFLDVFIIPLKYALAIGLPIAFVNLFLNILPTMVLRYNTPKLTTLYYRLLKKNA